MVKLQQVADC